MITVIPGLPELVAKDATVTVAPAATEPVDIVVPEKLSGSPNSLYVGVPIAEFVFLLAFM